MCPSEAWFGSVKDEVEDGFDQAEANWTLLTFKHRAIQVGQQFVRLTEENSQLQMARESEKSSIDKLMEMMVTMRMDDQKREREREEKREERFERERKEQRERGRNRGREMKHGNGRGYKIYKSK